MFTCLSFFFFFSSRRRHTRWTGDWSSDVCTSDLVGALCRGRASALLEHLGGRPDDRVRPLPGRPGPALGVEGRLRRGEIGRASCRERVESWGGGGWLKKKEGVRVR